MLSSNKIEFYISKPLSLNQQTIISEITASIQQSHLIISFPIIQHSKAEMITNTKTGFDLQKLEQAERYRATEKQSQSGHIKNRNRKGYYEAKNYE